MARYSHGMWPNEVYTRVGWKVHRLTKIPSWNMTKYMAREGRREGNRIREGCSDVENAVTHCLLEW